MKTDRYTKTVLTIIAFCLLVNTLDKLDIIPKAYANTNAPVMLPTDTAPKYGLVPLNEDGSINVTVTKSETMDVNIVGIRTFDEFDVNIDEVGGRSVNNEIPVKVVE